MMTGTVSAADRQRRGKVIAMDEGEREDFLATERTCRVATVGPDGFPHVSPLWFGWSGGALWLFSITRSRRWRDLEADPRVSVVVDAGTEYDQLRGVEITGRADRVGDIPRSGEPDPELAQVEQLFADKYMGGTFYPDGRHAWLRITPEKIVSWDFRKLAALGK